MSRPSRRSTPATPRETGSSSDSISLYGTMPAYADINGLTIEYGRFLKNTDVDNSSRVCVLSKQAAEQIVGYADCVGEDFSIDGMRYTIVGVLGERTSLVYGGSRVPRDYIPLYLLHAAVPPERQRDFRILRHRAGGHENGRRRGSRQRIPL